MMGPPVEPEDDAEGAALKQAELQRHAGRDPLGACPANIRG